MVQHSDTGGFEPEPFGGKLHWDDWFESVFKTAPMAIVVAGLDGRFHTCNPAFHELLGYDASALGSLGFDDVVHADDLEKNRAAIEDVLSERVPASEVECRFRRADGRLIWVNLKLSLLPERAGQSTGIVALLGDISDRVQTLAELHAMREQLERFIQDAPIPMAMVDRQMRYIRCSRRWISDYGLEGASIEGCCHYDLFPDLPQSWTEAHKRGLKGEYVKCGEDCYQWSDGRMQWLRWEVHPWHDSRREVAGLILFAEDISDRKQAEHSLRESEAHLRHAAESAHFGTFDIDMTTGVAHWSPEALSLLGLAPDACPTSVHQMERLIGNRATLQIGRQLQSAFHPMSDGHLRQDIAVTRPDGSRCWLQVHGRVVFDRDEFKRSAMRVSGMLLDITEMRQMQRNLEQSKRLEAIGRLSSGIAHDFNNLLTVIMSNLELAQRRIGDAETLGLIAAAIEALKTGASFNSRLLSLAKTRQTRPGLVNVGRHLDTTRPILSRAAGDKIELNILPTKRIWPVRADDAELNSTLLNLVLNAHDAMRDGGEITIGAENVDLDTATAEGLSGATAGEYVRIFVRDTGTGMPPEVAEQAQEPFFTTKTGGRGTGLGLTSAAAFAARENGWMHIETRPGHGTTMSVYLPRDHETENDAAPPEADMNDLVYGDGEVLLVVEDDDLVREATLKRLEVLGYVVHEARDAMEACERLDAGHHIDLVFSDVSMPGAMTGHDLVSRIRALYPSVGILLTTGDTPGQTAMEHADLAGTAFLAKPYSLAKLSRYIRDALNHLPLSPA
jgi:PAS domain S-box-containing protein